MPYYKIEDGKRGLITRSDEENRLLNQYEALLQNQLSMKVKEDKKEKFANPAILLGLKKDGIEI